MWFEFQLIALLIWNAVDWLQFSPGPLKFVLWLPCCIYGRFICFVLFGWLLHLFRMLGLTFLFLPWKMVFLLPYYIHGHFTCILCFGWLVCLLRILWTNYSCEKRGYSLVLDRRKLTPIYVVSVRMGRPWSAINCVFPFVSILGMNCDATSCALW